MTPRQLREQIEKIDAQLKELESWERKLTTTRRRWMINDSDDARSVVTIIDEGVARGQGRPAALDLPQLGAGWPGLQATRNTIAELKDRRAVLVEELPAKSETQRKTKEAEARAAGIRARAEDLAARTASAEAALNEATHLAVAVAGDTWRLWAENAALDKLTADADITRPDTPRLDAPAIAVAMPLGVVLTAHFTGGRPAPVDENLQRAVAAAVGEQTP